MDIKKVRVIDADDTQLDVELISILEDNGNKYLIYSKGEKQKSGNLIIYISKLKIMNDNFYLENIHDDSEWGKVKKLLGNIINN